jgi:3'-phosphoadenosine 5'-phosphosulfate sulfotransferase (PAPS reductase)/FAD synthetase
MPTVLQFSGGKDSLACLYLLEPRWNEITVAWVNTGAAFPETVALMERVRAQVPHFVEVAAEQSIEREGYPADVLPIAATSAGHLFEGETGPRFQSRYSCCASALWAPMQKAMRELGATTIIRGQKLSDAKKTPIRSGQVIEGVTYEFPLEDWTDADVRHFLAEKKVSLPENYRYMSTSLDCWNCTAYLSENAGRLQYLQERHPAKYERVVSVLNVLSDVTDRHLQPLRASL